MYEGGTATPLSFDSIGWSWSESALPCAVCNPEGQTDPSHSREGSLTTDIRKMLNKNVITTADSLGVSVFPVVTQIRYDMMISACNIFLIF